MLTNALATLLQKEKINIDDLYLFLDAHHLKSILPSLLLVLKKKADKRKEEESISIETPFPLSEENKKNIAIEIMKGEENVGKSNAHSTDTLSPTIKEYINPQLLLGYRAKYKEKVIHANLLRTLTRFLRK